LPKREMGGRSAPLPWIRGLSEANKLIIEAILYVETN